VGIQRQRKFLGPFEPPQCQVTLFFFVRLRESLHTPTPVRVVQYWQRKGVNFAARQCGGLLPPPAPNLFFLRIVEECLPLFSSLDTLLYWYIFSFRFLPPFFSFFPLLFPGSPGNGSGYLPLYLFAGLPVEIPPLTTFVISLDNGGDRSFFVSLATFPQVHIQDPPSCSFRVNPRW